MATKIIKGLVMVVLSLLGVSLVQSIKTTHKATKYLNKFWDDVSPED